MNIITISGPTAAGKDTIISLVLEKLRKEMGVDVSKANYFTTREIRDNEKLGTDILSCSESEFNDKIANGDLAYCEQIENDKGKYRVGSTWAELGKSKYTITNVSDKCAKILKDELAGKQGNIYTVFVHSPEGVRIRRSMLRESVLFEEMIKPRFDSDPTDPNPENHKDFDLIVENKENQETQTVEIIFEHVKEFIKETENDDAKK
jgi:guanylate kinase